MRIRHILTLATVVVAGMLIAQAQDAPPMHPMGPGPGGQDNVFFYLQEPGSPNIEFMHAQMLEMHEQIKGAPYTASAVTESTQVLADGNRIINKHSGFVARDGEGRTRREESLGHIGPLQVGGPNMVFIQDPVAQTAYVLNPDTKTANVITINGQGMHRKISAMTGGGEPEANAAIRVPLKGFAQKAEVKKESLGTQQIEGVTAEGTRITRTIPAGDIGNEKPIDIVSETWMSTDLHVLVLSKRSDPRMGETVYRLTNIKTGEPDPALFQVPSGFTTQQEPHGTFKMRRPEPPPR